MKNIYIEDGELTRKDHTIKLLKNGKITWIPIKKIKEINCLAGCTLTNEFLFLAKEHRISVHFYSYYGRYIGSFHHNRVHKNGKVLYHQSRYFETNQITLARSVVRALIMNQLYYLTQYRKKKDEHSKEAYQKIKLLISKLESCETIESIMGIEGISWSYFYNFIKTLYETYGFTGRNKRPPKDMINSLISFINTLLYNRIETEFSRTDIYTEISFLHSTTTKRNSLVLDISELYKIDVTFRLIGYLVRKKMITASDFEIVDEMCCISPEARKIVISEFERYLQKKYFNENLKKYVTIEHSMKLESYKLIRSFLENKAYEPLVISEKKYE